MLKFYIIFTFIFCSIASAANIEKIIVKGNERVSSDTVKMFAKVSELEDINDNDLNLILRRLYESNFFDVITYVVVCFMGGGYLGIHPISKIGKIIVILISLFKFVLLSEIILFASRNNQYINIYRGIKDIVTMEK